MSSNKELWWNKPQPDRLYSTDPQDMGWCTADVAAVVDGRQKLHATFRCYCHLDGSEGLLCSAKYHHTCVGGCNGRGACDPGYCWVSREGEEGEGGGEAGMVQVGGEALTVSELIVS